MKQAIQPVVYAESNGFGYCESLCLKYLTRHRVSSGNGKEDLEKAIHCLQMAIQIYYDEKDE